MKEQVQISRRGIVATAAALACGVAPALARSGAKQDPPPAQSPVAEAPRTIVLVRHAEKSAEDPRDPGLSEAGKLRAAALLRMLGETRITHVWTSEFKRTKETAAPVAEKHQLVPVAVSGGDLAALIARLKVLPPGSISLVVGHSNTLPGVAKAVGAALTNLVGGKDLRDDEYDRFVVITLARPDEPCALLEMRYGA